MTTNGAINTTNADELSALRLRVAEMEQQLAQLATSEERYRALANATSQIVWTADAQGLIVDDIPTWRALTGQSEADILGTGWLDAVHPDDREQIVAIWQQALAARSQYEAEYRVRRSDGVYRIVAARGVPVFTPEGQVREWVGTSTDVTDRKRLEEELRVFKALVEHSLDAIVISDLVGIITYANQFARKQSGYGDEIVGMAGSAFYPESELPKVAEIMATLQEHGVWQGTIVHQRKDRSAYPVQVEAYLICDDTGRPEAMAAISRDLTEQQIQERRLRENEVRLRTMLDQLPVIVYTLDHKGIITFSEGKGLELLGLKPGEAVGLSSFEMYKDFPDIVERLRLALSGESLTYVTEVSGMLFNNWIAPLYTEHGVPNGLIGVSFDVTAQRRAETEHQVLQEQIIESQQAALRELSTPLIPIAENVVVMPLIGTIDSRRAQQVLETLLVGIAEHQAETAILDITGVPVVDTQVANALLRAAQAAKLLGAQVILTGIRSDVAHTLVGLGADLSGIVTNGTLQSGIASALAR